MHGRVAEIKSLDRNVRRWSDCSLFVHLVCYPTPEFQLEFELGSELEIEGLNSDLNSILNLDLNLNSTA